MKYTSVVLVYWSYFYHSKEIQYRNASVDQLWSEWNICSRRLLNSCIIHTFIYPDSIYISNTAITYLKRETLGGDMEAKGRHDLLPHHRSMAHYHIMCSFHFNPLQCRSVSEWNAHISDCKDIFFIHALRHIYTPHLELGSHLSLFWKRIYKIYWSNVLIHDMIWRHFAFDAPVAKKQILRCNLFD